MFLWENESSKTLNTFWIHLGILKYIQYVRCVFLNNNGFLPLREPYVMLTIASVPIRTNLFIVNLYFLRKSKLMHIFCIKYRFISYHSWSFLDWIQTPASSTREKATIGKEVGLILDDVYEHAYPSHLWKYTMIPTSKIAMASILVMTLQGLTN